MTTPTPAPTNGWASKAPSDMTLEELSSAKQALQDDVDRLNSEISWKATANNAITSEIMERFHMTGSPGYLNPAGQPQYPAEQVAQAFG